MVAEAARAPWEAEAAEADSAREADPANRDDSVGLPESAACQAQVGWAVAMAVFEAEVEGLADSVAEAEVKAATEVEEDSAQLLAQPRYRQ